MPSRLRPVLAIPVFPAGLLATPVRLILPSTDEIVALLSIPKLNPPVLLA